MSGTKLQAAVSSLGALIMGQSELKGKKYEVASLTKIKQESQ